MKKKRHIPVISFNELELKQKKPQVYKSLVEGITEAFKNNSNEIKLLIDSSIGSVGLGLGVEGFGTGGVVGVVGVDGPLIDLTIIFLICDNGIKNPIIVGSGTSVSLLICISNCSKALFNFFINAVYKLSFISGSKNPSLGSN